MALGYPHPDFLLSVISSRQFSEWAEFYSVDPFGDERADLRAGIIAATMNNRWRNKNETPAEPVDFMPFHKSAEQTPEDIQRTLKSILGTVIAHGQGSHNRNQPGGTHRETDRTN